MINRPAKDININNMKKAMLSQPMNGKTHEKYVATKEKAMTALKDKELRSY